MSGARSATRSATSGTRVKVERVPVPWPPASPPCVTNTSAPASIAWRAWFEVAHLTEQRDTGCVYLLGERRRVAEREEHCRRLLGQHEVEQLGLLWPCSM